LAELSPDNPPARPSRPESGGLPALCDAVLAPSLAASVATYPEVIQTDHSKCPGSNKVNLKKYQAR
jgi:hypothetical protein